ncbi:hypothetical protein OE88DRAFT_1241072 [Heliocybe sulcata]|uniref:Uncharacterized protein n=1 Tax=Heliocybe sulcata TaxID=5364 RepID=A0A5C3N6B5_9AGAM|nr:hypothetical protein OE88DRAFT_1241072 [Heliocybe sulcata]
MQSLGSQPKYPSTGAPSCTMQIPCPDVGAASPPSVVQHFLTRMGKGHDLPPPFQRTKGKHRGSPNHPHPPPHFFRISSSRYTRKTSKTLRRRTRSARRAAHAVIGINPTSALSCRAPPTIIRYENLSNKDLMRYRMRRIRMPVTSSSPSAVTTLRYQINRRIFSDSNVTATLSNSKLARTRQALPLSLRSAIENSVSRATQCDESEP